jgi:hypothetical protein
LGAFWALGIASAMSVKLIHSRIYAQAATLAALGAAASLEIGDGREAAVKDRDPHEYRAPKRGAARGG